MVDFYNFDITYHCENLKYIVCVYDLYNKVHLEIDFNKTDSYNLVDYIKNNFDIFYYDYRNLEYDLFLKCNYNKLINRLSINKYKLYYAHKN